MVQKQKNRVQKLDQLKKYAEDLKKTYLSEKNKTIELEKLNSQLQKYAEDLNNTILKLKEANEKLIKQVEIEEREKLIQKKLIHTNKMTSIGTLASGIAHEIENPLNYIMANSQMISDIFNDMMKLLNKHHDELAEYCLGGIPFLEIENTSLKLLTANIEGIMRISSIIDRMKKYIRGESNSTFQKVDVHEAIEFSIALLNYQIRKYTNSFSLRLDEDIPPVKGNPQQIEQVIINILQNSLQSLPTRESGINLTSILDKVSGFVKIIIKDEGIGINKEIIDRITEPFFTTRRDLGGTGLGLYIVYLIIQEHNGIIDIKSEPGKGTEITISLPVYIGD